MVNEGERTGQNVGGFGPSDEKRKVSRPEKLKKG